MMYLILWHFRHRFR